MVKKKTIKKTNNKLQVFNGVRASVKSFYFGCEIIPYQFIPKS